MRVPGIFLATALALGMAGTPISVNALDVGGSVSKASKSVSKATRSATRSVSRTVGSTARGVSRSVSNTVGSTAKGVTSTVTSLSGGTPGNGGGGSSGGTTATVGVLNSYQLLSLGLTSSPAVPAQAGQEVSPAYVKALVASLDRYERQELEIKCSSVLRSPKAFDSELILLCQILASI